MRTEKLLFTSSAAGHIAKNTRPYTFFSEGETHSEQILNACRQYYYTWSALPLTCE
ncbi:hypothetical protein BDV24DRAFT_146226 [Aspergillus arachidicola]|uniref:Uncharacterized protein n=1 Tax=Aspergillus arachidicola TaxID=656916 RepID=A0A5N6XLU2_9EURO|nr:hypothetical protein BDV24DRAFT_146226 [Aspergillus arachidicola]